MQCNEKKHRDKESDVGLLVFYEGVMNERFVAVSTVTRSRISGCFSKLRRDFSVTRSGNRWWMQLDGLSNLQKKLRQSLSCLS